MTDEPEVPASSPKVIFSAEIDGQIRTIISAGAGFLVAKGWIASSFVEPITGVVMLILAAAWSWYSKK